MVNNDLYNTIFTRRSVREYRDEPLTAEDLGALREALASLEPIREGVPIELILWPEETPTRVLAYCEDTPIGRANVGFMLQQLDLFLQSRGIGGLWYGMGKEPKDAAARGTLKYAICYKFGYPQEKSRRENVSEFTRKPIEEVVSDTKDFEKMEAVRLAPSAMNSQPWFVEVKGPVTILSRAKGKFIKEMFLKKLNQLDMGIALCHAALALAHENGNPPPIALTREEASKAERSVILFQPE